MKLSYKNIDFEVDQDANKMIYGALTGDAESQKEDIVIRFYLSNKNSLFSKELIEFVTMSGIDLNKENELYHFEMDNVILVEGWYDIVGNILHEQRLFSFHWESGQCTTNMHFNADSTFGIRGELKRFKTFRMDFTIVIPKDKFPAS